MKKAFCLLLIGFLFANCSDTNEDTTTTPVEGMWKLNEARFYGFETGGSGENLIDYSDESIVYDFNQDGSLIVSGGDNAGYPNGTYTYEYGVDQLGGNNSPVVSIAESKWYYRTENGDMILSQAYTDGPELIFVHP